MSIIFAKESKTMYNLYIDLYDFFDGGLYEKK